MNGRDAPVLDRRLAGLLAVALLGVLAAVGLVVASLLGVWGAVGYVVLALVGLTLTIRWGTRVLRRAPLPAGRTCTCCTTSQHDPVTIL